MIKDLCLLLSFATLAVCATIPKGLVQDIIKSRKPGPSQNELVFVGQVMNKIYYAQRAENMTWADARKLCDSHGMALGTVETELELKFMKDANQPGIFDFIYWSAARDSHVTSQFRWDKGPWQERTEIMEDIYLYMDTESAPRSCCGVASWLGFFLVIPAPCDSRTEGFGALCETVASG